MIDTTTAVPKVLAGFPGETQPTAAQSTAAETPRRTMKARR
jgi:hypothetical protein